MSGFDQLAFLRELYPLHRTLVSDDLDLSLELIRQALPESYREYYRIVEVPTGTPCWTWTSPKKYSVKEAYLETEDGNRIADFNEHYLHIASYSQSVDGWVDYNELCEHLHYSEKRPDAIPWVFYYYKKDWAFCISYNQFKELDKSAKYRVVIDAEFTDGSLKIGELVVPGQSDEELLLISDVCHPCQVNDSLTGVSAFLDVLHRTQQNERNVTLRCLFLPETIGSIAYFSQNESVAKNIKWGVFAEMLGNDHSLSLQHSYPGDSYIDRVCRYAMDKNTESFREGAFRELVGNDELVTNGPGLRIPTISISRSKVTMDSYPEYHTSDDNPSMLGRDELNEATDVIEEIVRVIEADYTPQRLFKGPIFLSGTGLWGIWEDLEDGKERVDQIMYRLEGDMSLFEIAEDIGIDFWETKRICDAFFAKGLIEKSAKPRPQ